MAFGNPNGQGAPNSAPMTEINIIPLVDVMLVLLVIFIIAAPLLTRSVSIDLPQASSTPTRTRPDNIQLAIDGNGQLTWNGETIDAAALPQRLQDAGRLRPVPELQLRADRSTRYERIAELMSQASRAGVSRIGFVTQPKHAAGTAP